MRSLLKKFLEKPEKIVCVGLGKTGTTSFARAMTILGYRHKSQGHGFAFANRYMLPIRWTLRQYDSFDDFPWPYLYEFIKFAYPRSKFILTTRKSSLVWLDSLKRHYCKHGPSVNNKIFYGYNSPYENEAHQRRIYLCHNQRVRKFFAGDPAFLEVCFEEGHSWPEICGFLGRPIPKCSFPHENASKKEIAL